MTSKPVLYSPAMILAKRAGRKTNTRRLMTPQPHTPAVKVFGGRWFPHYPGPADDPENGLLVGKGKPLPYAVGDHLWTQENYRLSGLDGLAAAYAAGSGLSAICHYLADGEERPVTLTPKDVQKLGARKTAPTRPQPGRFMYRSCARDVDVVTAVRCERLHDITETDALAEGFDAASLPREGGGDLWAARYWFRDLWISLHGEKSWLGSPWVFAVTFRPVEPAP